MNLRPNKPTVRKFSRRAWLKDSAAAVAAGSFLAGLDVGRFAHAAGSDVIKIGFVGCGNRGTGACREALSTSGPVQLVAMGDLFAERLERSLKNLLKYDELRERIDVPAERRFTGFDAYEKVIAAGVDLVLLSTPPHFRPMQYAAAVKAGKHVFMEKPCCVDAAGYRLLVAANEEARRKRLSVVAGLQRRHQSNYLAGIQKIRDGVLGQIMYLRTYFNMPGGREGTPRPPSMGEMEYQIRHWNLFCWLCGDHLVEQACHEIDVANWVMDDHPLRAQGMGGRQVRTGPGSGDIFDHHAVEFEYRDGVRHFCQARQQAGAWSHVSDNVHGAKGMMTIGLGAWGMGPSTGPRQLRAKGFHGSNPYQREHDDLFASVRGTGPHRFEGDYAATSSMTAVLGRMATYSGQMITWDEAIRSTVVLAPERYALDAVPPTTANTAGCYPVAVPGVSKSF
jgi:predicted dehydrogenase